MDICEVDVDIFLDLKMDSGWMVRKFNADTIFSLKVLMLWVEKFRDLARK